MSTTKWESHKAKELYDKLQAFNILVPYTYVFGYMADRKVIIECKTPDHAKAYSQALFEYRCTVPSHGRCIVIHDIPMNRHEMDCFDSLANL